MLRCKAKTPRHPTPRQPTLGQIVTRRVGSAGSVSIACQPEGREPRRALRLNVAIVNGTVEIVAGLHVWRS